MNRRDLSTVAAPAALLGLLAMTPVASADDDDDDDKGRGKAKDRDKDRDNQALELPLAGRLSNGQDFEGSMTNLQFSVRNDGKLLLSGVLNGKSTGRGGERNIKDQAFQNVEATLTEADGDHMDVMAIFASAAPAQQTAPPPCPILHLVLGPLNLNLLGLVLTIPNPIIIDLTAVPGPGNLLGNLLCALVHLIDPNSALGNLLGSLLGGSFLTAFLNALNMALRGLFA
jgi:hypothetical protein